MRARLAPPGKRAAHLTQRLQPQPPDLSTTQAGGVEPTAIDSMLATTSMRMSMAAELRRRPGGGACSRAPAGPRRAPTLHQRCMPYRLYRNATLPIFGPNKLCNHLYLLYTSAEYH